MFVKLDHFPRVRGENKKNIGKRHHLVQDETYLYLDLPDRGAEWMMMVPGVPKKHPSGFPGFEIRGSSEPLEIRILEI